MKKIIALTLALVLVLGLVACGAKEAPATEAVAETDYASMTIEELKPLLKTLTAGW